MEYKDIILSLNIIESELNDACSSTQGGTSDSLTSIDNKEITTLIKTLENG